MYRLHPTQLVGKSAQRNYLPSQYASQADTIESIDLTKLTHCDDIKKYARLWYSRYIIRSIHAFSYLADSATGSNG